MTAIIGLVGAALVGLASRGMHFGDVAAAAIGGSFLAMFFLSLLNGGYL